MTSQAKIKRINKGWKAKRRKWIEEAIGRLTLKIAKLVEEYKKLDK